MPLVQGKWHLLDGDKLAVPNPNPNPNILTLNPNTLKP